MSMDRKESGYLLVSVLRKNRMCKVARALSSPERLDILQLLSQHSILNVGEIATAINLPASSASHHIGILEDAELISCEKQPSLRGVVKMCSRAKKEVVFLLDEKEDAQPRHIIQQLPLGAYSQAGEILKPCGLASASAPIGCYNNFRSFFLPERLQAEVLWFRGGYLEYDFSLLAIEEMDIQWLEISFEACSQAPVTTQAWKSAMILSVNGASLGQHSVVCDNRGRRGSLNPDWWPDVMTQSGALHTWRVDASGSYANRNKIGETSIQCLNLHAHPKITLRIAAPFQDQPGVNLFGAHFGDHKQGIVLEAGYTLRK